MQTLEHLDDGLFRSLSARESALVYGGRFVLARTYYVDACGCVYDGGDDLIEV